MKPDIPSKAEPRLRGRERSSIAAFVTYLRAHGYPDEAIAIESTGPGGLRTDIALVDPSTREFLAVVEATSLSRDGVAIHLRELHTRLLAYRRALRKPQLPVFVLAFERPSTEDPGFRIHSFSEDGSLTDIAPGEFPSYGALRGSVLAAAIESVETTQLDAERRFERAAFGVGSVLALLLVISIGGLWSPTWEELELVGGIAVVALLPQFQRLKLPGIELERLTRPRD